MKKRIYLTLILVALLGFTNSCDILEPEDDNARTFDDVKGLVTYAEGILINAYRNIPTGHQNFTLSYATDDAVNNDPNSNIKTVVSGGWTANSNPFSVWNQSYESIFYINTFLEELSDVEWYPTNDVTNETFQEKLVGEAYALRAWNYFHLLQAHAGMGSNGELLGVPIVDHVLDLSSPEAFQIPRSSFNELVNFIIADCDKAIDMLPGRWLDSGEADVDAASGKFNTNRINGHVARLIKTKTLLYAASPAYSNGTFTYQMAANAAAELMNDNNGLGDISGSRAKTAFYNDIIVTARGNTNYEVIWYTARNTTANGAERLNYAPSFYGEGLTNPSQNLVDAFPMKDGTPTPDSVINSDDPYSDRDPRLDLFVMHNGSRYKAGLLNTTQGSQDALNSTDPDATKTGYYLRKFMNTHNVDITPQVNSKGLNYYTYARYTDVLLMFAEAANEAGGPDANIGGFTAREVINAIRKRGKITSTTYVDGLGQSEMKDLIRNERRLEMCFEKQRFWDLRRWKMTAAMNAGINGVEVSTDATNFNYVEVEGRTYGDYQIYGPIPFNETLKYDIIQNQGW